MSANEPRLCIRCHQPVTVNYDDYDLFERMHWLCFHLEFEHTADPDQPCGDPSCPHWHVQVFREKLQELGLDPNEVLSEAIRKRYNL